MANVSFKKGLDANLSKVAISDGQVLVTTDKGEMYIDDENSRIKITDTDKANKVDYTPTLSAGNSDNLISKNKIEEKEPYNSRQAGGNKHNEIGNWKDETIVGGTICWNQLNLNNGSTTTYKECITATKNDNSSWTFTGENNSGLKIENIIISASNQKQLNHIYLFLYEGAAGMSNTTYQFMDANMARFSTDNAAIIKCTQANNILFRLAVYENYNFGNNGLTVFPMVFDLTQMFGEAIANYLLNQGSAFTYNWFKKLFPKEYYTPNTGTLMSVKPTAHRILDSEQNIVASYPLGLGEKELRGLYKLDENNNLYCDGDVYNSDGSVIRKYGKVDLGTLSWSYSPGNNNPRFQSETIENLKVSFTDYSSFILCNRYTSSDIPIGNNNVNKTIAVYNQKVYIHDESISSSATSSEIQTALSGVYLIYELATPTTDTKSANPYTNSQYIDNEGYEEYVDTREVAVPVGHISKYSKDLRKSIENKTWKTIINTTLQEETSNTQLVFMPGGTHDNFHETLSAIKVTLKIPAGNNTNKTGYITFFNNGWAHNFKTITFQDSTQDLLLTAEWHKNICDFEPDKIKITSYKIPLEGTQNSSGIQSEIFYERDGNSSLDKIYGINFVFFGYNTSKWPVGTKILIEGIDAI